MSLIFILIVRGLLCVSPGCIASEVGWSGQEPPPVYTPYSSEWSSPLVGCAPPPYSIDCFDVLRESNATYMATVEFKSFEGTLYQVRWDLFGQSFNGSSSIEAVLERSLLAGDNQGFFKMHDSEVERVFKGDGVGLKGCLSKGHCVSYDDLRGALLRHRHLSEMFPVDEYKKWRVLEGNEMRDLMCGEMRILFDGGGLSCLPTPTPGAREIPSNSIRCAQMEAEDTTAFVEKVRYYAEEKKSLLQEEMSRLGKDVHVRYVTGSGKVLTAYWDGSQVFDATGRGLLDFLQDCVLLGCNLGYVDEGCEKHYAFTNECLRDLLRKCLALDLARNVNVFFATEGGRLTSEDLLEMPYMSWTVVERGRLRRPEVRYACAISFAGATLEGVPRCLQRFVQTYLLPRNFLWAVCYDEVMRAHPTGFWYINKLGWDAPRLHWYFSHESSAC